MADSERPQIAHLFRRAAFGATPAELDYYAAHGYTAAVDDLISGKSLAGKHTPPTTSADDVGAHQAERNYRNDLHRMQKAMMEMAVTSATPLRERMTLFLLNHFATPFRPDASVGGPEINTQVYLFREHALGHWNDLVHAAVEDVALACSLDAHLNNKAHPNENLARELMERFTLGTGAYSEADVREGARALTGFRLAEAPLAQDGRRYRLIYDKRLHDDGRKQIFGSSGNFAPHDFVNLILSKARARGFLAQRLAAAFLSPQPPQALVNKISLTLQSSGWNLGAAMRTLFMSPEFRGTTYRRALVKSPVELAAGALRALHSSEIDHGVAWARAAGQSMFQPPNVGGWPGNEAWLFAGGLLARYNGAVALASKTIAAHQNGTGYPRAADPMGWARVFGMTELHQATMASLNRFMADARGMSVADTDRNLITLVLASPDFSLA